MVKQLETGVIFGTVSRYLGFDDPALQLMLSTSFVRLRSYEREAFIEALVRLRPDLRETVKTLNGPFEGLEESIRDLLRQDT